MQRTTWRGITAAGALVALVAVGVPTATATEDPPGTETPSVAPADPEVASTAEAVATDFTEGLEAVYEEVFVNAAPEEVDKVSQEAVLGLVSDDVLTESGEQSLQDYGESIAGDATALTADPAAEIIIDEVAVEQVSEIVVNQVDAETVSAVVDVEITRHVAGDDIDWVEVIPHEIVITDGQVLEVIPHDLEYLMENTPPEPEQDKRLMQVPGSDDAPYTTEPTALSATNRQKVANYALKYALSPNNSYKLYPNDCTNFVSQSMFAGGWKEVAHPYVDYKNDDAWWYGGVPTNSWTWSGAENFYRMTKALKRTTTAKYVSDLRVGDLLQYKAKNASTMTHSMVVTAKSGSTVYLSYHTSNTKNKPFTQLSGLSVTWFGHHV
jgi:hypothetical protein